MDTEAWQCVALTQMSRGCSRTVVFASDRLAEGFQPLCHQHGDAVEDQLQRICLGLADSPAPDSSVIANDLRLRWIPEKLRRCVAILGQSYERCHGLPALPNFVGRSVPAGWQPLCSVHTEALTKAMWRAWDDLPGRRNPDATWGWQLADAYQRPRLPAFAERRADQYPGR